MPATGWMLPSTYHASSVAKLVMLSHGYGSVDGSQHVGIVLLPMGFHVLAGSSEQRYGPPQQQSVKDWLTMA